MAAGKTTRLWMGICPSRLRELPRRGIGELGQILRTGA